MSSGCTSNNSSNSCFETTTDNCVKYTGDNIPLLDICQGDTLSEVEEAIITKLLSVTDGTGLELSDLTFDCDFMSSQMVGKDATLDIILQVLINSSCTLKDLIDDVSAQVNLPVTYDPACLGTGTYTTQSLLQAAVNELCALKTQVENLTSQVNSQPLPDIIKNYAGNLISSNIISGQKLYNSATDYGISKTGSGENATLTFYGFLPPFTPVFCYAPLYWFDSSGRGLSNTPMNGFYICNGLNNTVDYRGYTTAGATNLPGINGPGLQYAVDPIAQNDPSIATNILDRKGMTKVQLAVSEMPSHTHTATDSGHSHSVNILGNFNIAGGFTASGYSNQGSSQTSAGYANISVSSTGGNSKHENRQPTTYGYYITRLF